MSPVSEENGLLAEGSGEGDVAVVVTNVEGSEASGGKASLALALHLKGESLVLQVVRQIKTPCFILHGVTDAYARWSTEGHEYYT